MAETLPQSLQDQVFYSSGKTYTVATTKVWIVLIVASENFYAATTERAALSSTATIRHRVVSKTVLAGQQRKLYFLVTEFVNRALDVICNSF